MLLLSFTDIKGFKMDVFIIWADLLWSRKKKIINPVF